MPAEAAVVPGFLAGTVAAWALAFGLLVDDQEPARRLPFAPLDSLELIAFIRLASVLGGSIAGVAAALLVSVRQRQP